MNATTPIPEGYVLHMPALKHSFGEAIWVPSHKSCSGFAQTERTCKVCGAVKVTLHLDGDGGRAWRRSADAAQIETFEAPVCVPVANAGKSE